MAEGRFAPGHLGELTQLVPFEMVDEALMATRTVQSRLRDLPSRVVIYLILAACLFPEVGYPGVWRKLTGALAGLPLAVPSASALAQARRRVGSKPVRWLFDLLRGPAPTTHGPGARRRGLLVAALLPARRLRVSPRIVKRAISKYQARGPRIDRTSYKATTGIEILAPAGP
ncbi:transposase domain-containing protein [Streptomyces sp. NBC_00847]|uniref:transposase domain-containing protein n=1 Tax=Streptomyces sp. NBC_00847 TaxID=2975850 RepID=UPI0022515A89|nr:transposase domain-containing protein [Streptomyces sp. NBC_00847]MCX4880916.1 transposase domain-containing protein [Streptomyces sp. NBC_00847]